jgi:DNA/RNA-binding domain of Phe-tRNA-synthetase-like protein
VDNTQPSSTLEDAKRRLEADLRSRYAGYTCQDFLALPVLQAYHVYYRRFDKTYHVLLQLESVVLKNKTLPSVSPLVDANFSAELETLILAASHDADCLSAPVEIGVTRPGDAFTQMGGVLKSLPPGDMLMRDGGGIACTILYGQDARSPITAATTHALYVAYVPAGMPESAVEAYFAALLAKIRLFAPGCQVLQQNILRARRLTASASRHSV